MLALVLTSCPANRDGMPGQLATAKEETQAAARSAALALQLWSDHRSTGSLASVQITDARDEVAKAYKGVAELKADNQIDLDRQRLLTETMTALIDDLNTAAASVRGDPVSTRGPLPLGQHLLVGADALEHTYR
ncbi:hypothetical protein ACTXG7_08370 [Mycolicibacterium sp. Dal123E01]|uniref:hypothetical protein n=1 Tax=Mycolicibacterium sp. Dal123E01 TaxID=3457578 RepID=UPI00403E3B02